jgi:hypothetical protein
VTPITKHSWIWHFVAVAACSSDFTTAGRLHQLEDLERATASAAPSEPAWRQLVTVHADTSSATSSARERASGTRVGGPLREIVLRWVDRWQVPRQR